MVLAWAVVESENKDSWRYFFKHLIRVIPEIEEEETVFISDRDKGLSATDNKLRDKVIKAVCTYYLIDNFTTKFSRILKPLFWRIYRANLKARFESLIDELRKINELTAQYLLDALPELWAKSYFIGTRFGYDISNIVKSINKILKLDRELPIVQLLDSLWNYIMDQRFH